MNIGLLTCKAPFPVPDYKFPGLDPIMTSPPLEEVHKAEISLALAQHSEESGHSKGISPNDAKLLLDWIIYNSRQEQIKEFKSPEVFKKAVDDLTGTCDVARFMTSMAADELGLEKKRLMTGDLFPLEGTWFPHKFTVVTIPVEQEIGNLIQQPYLLDSAYRQFFDPAKPVAGALLKKPVPAPGFVLARTEEGRTLADSLLKDGYVALNEQAAKLYLTSFNENFKPAEGSYLRVLTHPSICDEKYNDVSARWKDTSPPLERLRQERLEAMSMSSRQDLLSR